MAPIEPIKPYNPRQFLSKSNASLGCVLCATHGVFHDRDHLYEVDANDQATDLELLDTDPPALYTTETKVTA